MEVEVVLEEGRSAPKVIILTGELSKEIETLRDGLADGSVQDTSMGKSINALIGYSLESDQVFLIIPGQVLSIFAQKKQVFAKTATQTVRLKSPLYELEQRLASGTFLRISNSEIVNFSHVKMLDFSIGGTILLRFSTGDKTFVSRRYMAKIKNYLGM